MVVVMVPSKESKLILYKSAFSLVELLVSFAVLMTVLIPVMVSFSNIARSQYSIEHQSINRNKLNSIYKAIERFEEKSYEIDYATMLLSNVFKNINFDYDNVNIYIKRKSQESKQLAVPYLYQAKELL